MALSSGATHVKEMPRYTLPVDVHVEDMFGDAHCLDASM